MRFFSIVLFAFVFNFSSCGFSKHKEPKKEVAPLTEQKKDAESNLAEYAKKVAEQDSIEDKITELTVKTNHSTDSVQVAGDTMSIEQLRAQKAKLIARNRELTDTIALYRDALKEIFTIEGNKAERVVFKDQSFDCYVAKTNNGQIQFFLRDEDENKPYLSLNNLKDDLLSKKGKQLVFASNAGMYMGNNEPQGLFIQNGLELAAIDKKKDGYGNFYLQPNGIFFIDAAGTSRVTTTESYLNEKPKTVKYATQSGPMLVIDDKINEKFTKGSTNKNIRNGVGIIDSNLVVFVISNQPVNFFDFASLFKEQFKCKNALYLDGAISRTYLPELARLQLGGNFGPMIGIFK